MHKVLAGIVALTALAACAGPAPLAPPGNVNSGVGARTVDVDEYQCSVSEPERCECERAAFASGMSVETARLACAP